MRLLSRIWFPAAAAAMVVAGVLEPGAERPEANAGVRAVTVAEPSGPAAVKEAGETETGMTVHWVTPVCDSGEIIAQYKVALSPEDTVDDIAEKEHLLEMKYFPKVVEEVLSNL